jgi:hypothetical protein
LGSWLSWSSKEESSSFLKERTKELLLGARGCRGTWGEMKQPSTLGFRQATIDSLLRLGRPLAELRAAPATLDGDWDHAPVGTLTRQHVATILTRFEAAELDDAAVEVWANLIECREDIGYEAGYDNRVLV